MSAKDVREGGGKHEQFPKKFDDDLNENWESAIQGDDFMFSSDEDTEDFFKPRGQGQDDVDLSSLGESKPEQYKSGERKNRSKRKSALPFWLKTCLILLPVLIVALLFFLYSPTTSPPPLHEKAGIEQQSEPAKKVEKPVTTAAQKPEVNAEAGAEAIKENRAHPEPALQEPEVPILPDKKVRNRYNLPPIFITATADEGNKSLFVSANVTLVANLAPDSTLMEEERMRAADIIYQFFKKRTAEELEAFALDRGKMITGLQEWVRTNWPDNSFTSVIMEGYRVDKL